MAVCALEVRSSISDFDHFPPLSARIRQLPDFAECIPDNHRAKTTALQVPRRPSFPSPMP